MENQTKPTFDPTKHYTWNPEDVFNLTGQEFSFVYNNLVVKKQELLTQLEIIKLLEQKLQKALEDNIIKEITPEEIKQLTENKQ